MKKITTIILTVFFIWNFGTAQDVAFSQFYAAPLYLNPALSGAYNGSYKLTAIYRDQWRGAYNEPLYTTGISGDARFNVSKRPFSDAASGGIMFLTDRTSIYNYNTTFIGLTGAYHRLLDGKNDTYLSGGFRFSMINKSINYENLTFQDQFNGVDQFVFGTSERLPFNSLSFADLVVGLNFSTKPSSNSLFSIGASVSHILNNNISFYKKEELIPGGPQYIQDVRIKKLFQADAQYTFPVSRIFHLSPRAVWRMQGKFMELNLGSSSRLRFKKDARFAMHFGAWGRGNNYLDSYNVTSVVVLAGFEVNEVTFAFSYDANIMDNIQFKTARNAFEFSVSYIGNLSERTVMCPEL